MALVIRLLPELALISTHKLEAPGLAHDTGAAGRRSSVAPGY